MTREEKIFEMAKALAPSIANAGIALQNNLVQRGHKPQDCMIGDKNIPHAYGESLMVWATAFVDELDAVCKTSPKEQATESILKITEWCPHCESEVDLIASKRPQRCPNCGKWILPCSLCESCDADCDLNFLCKIQNALGV